MHFFAPLGFVFLRNLSTWCPAPACLGETVRAAFCGGEARALCLPGAGGRSGKAWRHVRALQRLPRVSSGSRRGRVLLPVRCAAVLVVNGLLPSTVATHTRCLRPAPSRSPLPSIPLCPRPDYHVHFARSIKYVGSREIDRVNSSGRLIAAMEDMLVKGNAE